MRHSERHQSPSRQAGGEDIRRLAEELESRISEDCPDLEGSFAGLKKSLRDLVESEELYRLLADNATDVISRHTPEGVYTYASPAARSLLGYDPEELVGRSAYELLHPEDLRAVERSHETILAGTDVYTVSYRIRRRDGGYTWFETTSRAIRAPDSGEVREIVAVSRDVTGRRRAENQLREAQNRYQALVERVPAIIYTGGDLDKPGSTRYVSPQIEEVLGYSPQDFAEDPGLWERIIHPDDRSRVFDETELSTRTGEPFKAEYRMVAQDGRVVWVRDEAVLVWDTEGRTRYWQGVKLDITEQKLAEARLQEFSKRISSILESITDAFFALDREWRFTFLNSRAEQLLRRPREELLGTSVWEAYPGIVGSRFQRKYLKAVQTQEAAHFEEFYAPLDGWFEVHAYPSQDGLAVYFRDVTERRRTEEELREAEERFRSAFHNTPVGMALVNLEGRYLQVNRALGEILGYPEDELLGKTYMELTYPEDREISGDYARRIERGELDSYNLEKRYVHAEGLPVWVSLSVSIVRDARGKPLYYIAQLQDITERKQVEEDLQDTARRLSEIVSTQYEIAAADLDLSSVMNLIAERTQRLTGAAGASVELVEDDEVVQKAGSGTASKHYGLRLKMDRSLSGACIQKKEIMRSGDTERDLRVDREACRRLGARSLLVVPLYHAQRVVGVLNAFSPEPHAFNDRDVHTLQLMAGLIAAAMSHTAEFEAKKKLLAERTASLAKIRHSEARFRAIFEGSAAGIAILGLDGSFLQVNPALQKLLGYGAEELEGKNSSAVAHPEDLDKTSALHRELAAGERESYEVERRYVKKDGRVIWGRLNVSLIRTPEGKPDFAIGMLENITDRKRAEEALRNREQQQAIVARLGQRALAGVDLHLLLDEAVTLVSQTLGVEHTKFLELHSDEGTLFLRTGTGWKKGYVGRATVNAGTSSQAGYALLTREPAVTGDLQAEERFSASQLQREHGITSGASVVVHGQQRPYGVLGVDTPTRREFTEDDINFLQAIANVLATAIERAHAEETLRKSELLSRSTINSLSAHIAILDESGIIIDVNEAWRRFARSNTPVVGGLMEGVNYLEVCDAAARTAESGAEDAAAFARGIREVLSGNLESFDREYPCHGPEGPCWFVGRVTRFPDTHPPRVVIAHENITERRLAEEAVRTSEREYRRLFELANDAIIIYDPQNREILDVNENACRMYGYPRYTFVGMTMKKLSLDRQKARRYLEILLVRGSYEDFETVHRRYDGSPINVLVNSSLIEYRGRPAVLSINRDLTARKKTEASLLEIREAERRRIARDLHDAVLQDLAGALQGLQAIEVESTGNGLVAGFDAEIEALRRAVGGLREAIYDLRKEKEEPFVRAVEALVELNRQMAPERQIKLSVTDDFSQDIQKEISVELLRVLQEALANVRHHSGARTVRISLCRQGDQIHMEVYDDGRGFDTRREPTGGVGLSGMRERVEELSGDLEIKSIPDKGTLVKVRVPYRTR